MFGALHIPGPMLGSPSHYCEQCQRLQYAGQREWHEGWCPKLPPTSDRGALASGGDGSPLRKASDPEGQQGSAA